jgi:hypothetical protein
MVMTGSPVPRRRPLLALLVALGLLATLVVGTLMLKDDGAPGSAGPKAQPSAAGSPSVWAARPMPTYKWSKTAAPVVLRLSERDITLRPWTTCWSGPPGIPIFGQTSSYCADGAPGLAGALDDVGSPSAVDFWFGMPGWKFNVSFKQLGTDCPHSWSVPAVATGNQTFRATPAGPPGRYEVTLEGRGKQGDAFMSFVWKTPTAGPVNPPEGYLALIYDRDGHQGSYGVELSISQLGETPRKISAQVSATAANGKSLTLPIALERDESRTEGSCYDAGSLFFTSPEATGERFAALGPAPFSYKVALKLDGTTYTGTATWPRDEKKDEEPNTTLTFTPPLPAYPSP